MKGAVAHHGPGTSQVLHVNFDGAAMLANDNQLFWLNWHWIGELRHFKIENRAREKKTVMGIISSKPWPSSTCEEF